jgi:endogenous inhibitor of DNA gyrase (YacG/DUF329 family)
MSIKGRCPICRKPSVHEFRPFCSRGCRDRDFIGWADGRYKVPAPPSTEESEEDGGS